MTICSPFTLGNATASYSNGVFGGLNRLLAGALVAGALFVLPSTALADGCGGGPSAENVYKECLQTGGGGKPTSGSHTGGGTQGSAHASVPVSKQTAKKLKRAGDDGTSLAKLMHTADTARLLQSHSPTGEPTAIGSAFDLGSGPTVLLIVLAGTAILLLGATGFRYTRHRH
jgi:hypothetical protein